MAQTSIKAGDKIYYRYWTRHNRDYILDGFETVEKVGKKYITLCGSMWNIAIPLDTLHAEWNWDRSLKIFPSKEAYDYKHKIKTMVKAIKWYCYTNQIVKDEQIVAVYNILFPDDKKTL